MRLKTRRCDVIRRLRQSEAERMGSRRESCYSTAVPTRNASTRLKQSPRPRCFGRSMLPAHVIFFVVSLPPLSPKLSEAIPFGFIYLGNEIARRASRGERGSDSQTTHFQQGRKKNKYQVGALGWISVRIEKMALIFNFFIWF